MGTRSVTKITDNQWPSSGPAETLVAMYRQFDGYPEGHGLELARFLAPKVIVNGIPGGVSTKHLANGAGCLAAQVLAHFKAETGVGGIYIHPLGSASEDYNYLLTVNPPGQPLTLVVTEYDDTEPIFNGTIADYLTHYNN